MVAVWNLDGSLAQEQIIENTVCTVGKAAIANQLTAGSLKPNPAPGQLCCVGTGTMTGCWRYHASNRDIS